MRFTVRTYEVDQNGHLNGSVYVQWADHVRWETARRAGVSMREFVGSGVGPVNLQTTISYFSELRDGDEVDVSCEFEWTDGKTMRIVQEFRRPDGEIAAELVSVGGVLDLETRTLVADPRDSWSAFAKEPELLGL